MTALFEVTFKGNVFLAIVTDMALPLDPRLEIPNPKNGTSEERFVQVLVCWVVEIE